MTFAEAKRKEGLEQGRQEGAQEGSLQHSRDTLIRLIDRKFGLTDAERDQITACGDIAVLDAALDEFAVAESKAPVLGKLGQSAAYGIESRLAQGEGATGSCVILVTPDGERSMNTHLGMCQEFSGADYLSLTGYMWDTEIQKDAITRAIQVARPAGAGDMLAAGFLAGLALGQGARKASVLAGELAERVIAKTGAQFGFEEIVAIRRELLVAVNAPAD